MSIKSQLQSTAPEGGKPITGQDLTDLTRFAPDTQHMIIFDALTWDCPVGGKGERVRVFLTDEGYKQAIDAQEHGQIKVVRHARVRKGYIYYAAPERDHEEY
ncbi:hypothetical protein FACS1894191_1090 [Clostridia bacterium]|nr:hypothetical protein FACS1894191_1090 [Clostridia bacterium]